MSFLVALILDPISGQIDKYQANIVKKINQAIEVNKSYFEFNHQNERIVVELPLRDEVFTWEKRLIDNKKPWVFREIMWNYFSAEDTSLPLKVCYDSKQKKYYYKKKQDNQGRNYDTIWVELHTEYLFELQQIEDILNHEMETIWQWCEKPTNSNKICILEEDDWHYYPPDLNQKFNTCCLDNAPKCFFEMEDTPYLLEYPSEGVIYTQQKNLVNTDYERLVRCIQMTHGQYILLWIRQPKRRPNGLNFFYEQK
jgi:hypothetical protein